MAEMKRTTVYVERGLHLAARAQGVNVSRVLNQALRALVGTVDHRQEKLETLEAEIRSLRATIPDPRRSLAAVVHGYPEIDKHLSWRDPTAALSWLKAPGVRSKYSKRLSDYEIESAYQEWAQGYLTQTRIPTEAV